MTTKPLTEAERRAQNEAIYTRAIRGAMGDTIPKGLCQCGCGAQTPIITQTKPSIGHFAGEPLRYLNGHNRRRWDAPYRTVKTADGMRTIHRLRAERALGRPLPPRAVVHHADGSKSEYAPLVICEDQGYHGLLHARMRIVQHGGNPNIDAICRTCQRARRRECFPFDCRGPFGVNSQCHDCMADDWRAKNEAAPWRKRRWAPRPRRRASWFRSQEAP